MFFVATAPSGPDGHVNVSPKGIAGSFVVLDEHRVAYLDLTASGAETIAHLRDNGRITIMFCAFDGPPNIVRLHGHGRFVTLYDEGFDELPALFPAASGRARGDRGRGRPRLGLVRVRRAAHELRGRARPAAAYMERKGVQGRADYRRLKNRVSIDGLPGFDMDPVRRRVGDVRPVIT